MSPFSLLLKESAHEIAASLAEDVELAPDGPTALLSGWLLEESPDASDAAAMRGMLLRTDLVVAVRQAIAQRPEPRAKAAAEGSQTPAVRVELRGTAGRTILRGAFFVGSDPKCDVQAHGEESVRPLHCVALPLPGGLLIVDAWSSSTSQMDWCKEACPPLPPQTGCGKGRATLFAHGERVVFRIGEKTTVAFGPQASAITGPAAATVEAVMPWSNSKFAEACSLKLLPSGHDAFLAAISDDGAMFRAALKDDTNLNGKDLTMLKRGLSPASAALRQTEPPSRRLRRGLAQPFDFE